MRKLDRAARHLSASVRRRWYRTRRRAGRGNERMRFAGLSTFTSIPSPTAARDPSMPLKPRGRPKANGMRAIVIKNHYEFTSGLALHRPQGGAGD